MHAVLMGIAAILYCDGDSIYAARLVKIDLLNQIRVYNTKHAHSYAFFI